MWFVNTVSFIKSFIYDKIYKYILVGAYMSFSFQKGEFDRFFNGLDRPFEESRPDRFPSLSSNFSNFFFKQKLIFNCVWT